MTTESATPKKDALPDPLCTGCNTLARDLEEYQDATLWHNHAAVQENDADVADILTIEEYVRSEEGTYNKTNGHFLCTWCYIAAGVPSSPKGWVAP